MRPGPKAAAATLGLVLGGAAAVRRSTAVERRDPARDLPPEWEPAALTAVARWNPPRIRSCAGRVAVRVWASPVTLGGLVAGAAAAVPPRLSDGVLLFAGARGLTGATLRRRGFAAGAIGHVIVTRDARPDPRLLSHERVHVRQAERLGPFFPLAYLGLLAPYGYARHPFERAARRAAATVA